MIENDRNSSGKRLTKIVCVRLTPPRRVEPIKDDIDPRRHFDEEGRRVTHPSTPAAARPHVLLLMSEGTFDLQFHAEQVDRLRELAEVGRAAAARRPGRPDGSRAAGRGRRDRHLLGCTADHAGAPRRRTPAARHPARRRHRARPGARRGLGAGDRRDLRRRRERAAGRRVHARGDHPGRQARTVPRRRGPHPSRPLVVRRRARRPEQPRPDHRHRRLVPHRAPHGRAARRPGDRRASWSPTRTITADDLVGTGAELVDLPELLRRSDIVSLHAPALPETRHLIGAAELALHARRRDPDQHRPRRARRHRGPGARGVQRAAVARSSTSPTPSRCRPRRSSTTCPTSCSPRTSPGRWARRRGA